MKHVQNLLEGFGTQVGLPQLALDAANCCTLQFDDVVVNIEYINDTEEMFFYSRVGGIPANTEDKLRAYARLLDANCFYRRTHGGVLGIDEGQDAIVYTNKVGIGGLDANAFGDYMEAFVNRAEEFATELRDESGGDGGGDAPDPSMMGMRV